MFVPDLKFENAIRFSRFDPEHLLSTSHRPLFLEDHNWPSAEHYVNTMLASSKLLKAKVLAAESGQEAYKLVKPWYRPKIRNWKTVRRVYMTRALYTLVQMYPEIEEYLIGTEKALIAESSAYDHYWGIGRDQRGENMTGKVWMDIREKIYEKGKSQSTEQAVDD